MPEMYASYDDGPVRGSESESPIAGASQSLAAGLSELEVTATQLEKRLQRVLRPSEAAIAGERLQSVPSSGSPHTAELRKHDDFLRQQIDRLRSVLDRLDI